MPPLGDTDIVRYTLANGRDGNDSQSPLGRITMAQDPKYLVLHESIKRLMHEVLTLTDRCSDLETSNDDLRYRLSIQERHSECFTPAVQAPPSSNLTGYPDSNAPENEPLTDTRVDVQRELEMVVKILGHHETKINSILAGYEDLTSRFTTLETLREDFEPKKRTNGAESESQEYLEPPSKAELALVSNKIEELDQKLKNMAIRSGETDDGEDASVSGSSARGQSVPVSGKDVADLKAFAHGVWKTQKMEQRIDDAATKDALYLYFKQIGSIMEPDGKRRRKNGFEGTFEDLLTLRNRVSRRLAGFDAFSTAFQEANEADVVM